MTLGTTTTPTWAFPVGSDGKESACNAGDLGLIPGLGRSRAEGNSYLKNSMDRGAWRGQSPWGHKELDPTENLTHTPTLLPLDP